MRDVVYEFYASQSGLEPDAIFTKSTHEREFYSPGDTRNLDVKLLQVEYWRANSGLDPEQYTDNEHLDAWIAKLKADGYKDEWADALRADIISQRNEFINLATNPRFKRAVAGSTVVRRNLWKNPAPSGVSGFGTPSPVAFPAVNYVDGWVQWVSAISGSVSGDLVGAGSSDLAVSLPGTIYTVSFDVLSSVDLSVKPAITARRSNGSNIATLLGGASLLEAGVVKRLSVTATTPLNTGLIGPRLAANGSVSVASGDSLKIRNVLVEQRPAVLPYFDGDTADALGFDYSWEGTAGASTSVIKTATVEVRRNLGVDPRGTALSSSGPRISNTRWSGDGSYSLLTGIADGPVGISTAVAFTVTTARSGHGFDIASNPEGSSGTDYSRMIPVTPGNYVTLSLWVKKTGASVPIYVGYRFADASGNWLTGSALTNPTVATSSSSWVRVSGTILAPSGAAWASLNVRSTLTDSVGDIWSATGLLIEKTSVVLPYFDGSMTPDADLMPAWTGTPNASTSVLYGVAVEAVNGYFPSRTRRFRHLSDSSVRAFRTEDLGGNAGFIIPGTTIAEAGQEVTALAEITAPLGGTLAIYNTSGVPQGAVSIPPSASKQWVRAFGTAPSGYSSAGAAVFTPQGAIGEDLLRVHQLLLVRGHYTGPYFDGDTPGALWLGEPHASASGK